jgi:hypothetical protein
MNRYHLLAAEIFGYSYANYDDHLGIDHIRYETLMPDTTRTLERAEAECWPLEKVARKLELDELEAAEPPRALSTPPLRPPVTVRGCPAGG